MNRRTSVSRKTCRIHSGDSPENVVVRVDAVDVNTVCEKDDSIVQCYVQRRIQANACSRKICGDVEGGSPSGEGGNRAIRSDSPNAVVSPVRNVERSVWGYRDAPRVIKKGLSGIPIVREAAIPGSSDRIDQQGSRVDPTDRVVEPIREEDVATGFIDDKPEGGVEINVASRDTVHNPLPIIAVSGDPAEQAGGRLDLQDVHLSREKHIPHRVDGNRMGGSEGGGQGRTILAGKILFPVTGDRCDDSRFRIHPPNPIVLLIREVEVPGGVGQWV